MTNNDVLRRLRYCFDIGDDKMIAIFGLGGKTVTRAEISDLLKRDEDPAFQPCHDRTLGAFLDGWIIERRGPREDGAAPRPVKRLTNNVILMKIRIALNLKTDDVLEILDLAGMSVGKSELSALFRRPDHKHYRECKDQFLRNFLKGVQLKYRPGQ